MTTLINTETALINLVHELSSIVEPVVLAPMVDDLAGVQGALVGLLSQEATSLASDPAFQTDLANLITNEGALVDMISQVPPGSSS